MCVVAQKSPEHQEGAERPRIPVLRTSVNRALLEDRRIEATSATQRVYYADLDALGRSA
jgi:hypothetical protein